MRRTVFFLFCIAAMLSSCTSTEVEVSSALSGEVIDVDTSQPLAGCVVSISPGKRSVSTDGNGSFDFGTLDMGEYRVVVNLNGYGMSETDVRLEPSKSLHIKIKMKKATVPVVATSSAKSVTGTTALLSGTITATGGVELIEVGFYYGKTNVPEQKVIAEVVGANLSCTITDLYPETQYYYKAYARNALGEACGEVMSFKTPERQLSEVTTLDATSITATTAVLQAEIMSNEKGVEKCGFYIGKSETSMTKHEALPNKTFFLEAKNLTPSTYYYYRAYISDDKNENVGVLKTFTTEMLSYNEHYYVDLGLPSGLKWAGANIGASSPEAIGSFFSWAETLPKERFEQDNYKYLSLTSSETVGNITTNEYDFIKYTTDDRLKQLEESDDAACVNWMGKWKIPDVEAFKELINKCTWEWTSINGQDGYKVIGPNGSFIFLPYVGFYGNKEYGEVFHKDYTLYWGSTLSSSIAYGVSLKIDSNSMSVAGYLRYFGALIRPVFK